MIGGSQAVGQGSCKIQSGRCLLTHQLHALQCPLHRMSTRGSADKVVLPSVSLKCKEYVEHLRYVDESDISCPSNVACNELV